MFKNFKVKGLKFEKTSCFGWEQVLRPENDSWPFLYAKRCVVILIMYWSKLLIYTYIGFQQGLKYWAYTIYVYNSCEWIIVLSALFHLHYMWWSFHHLSYSFLLLLLQLLFLNLLISLSLLPLYYFTITTFIPKSKFTCLLHILVRLNFNLKHVLQISTSMFRLNNFTQKSKRDFDRIWPIFKLKYRWIHKFLTKIISYQGFFE